MICTYSSWVTERLNALKQTWPLRATLDWGAIHRRPISLSSNASRYTLDVVFGGDGCVTTIWHLNHTKIQNVFSMIMLQWVCTLQALEYVKHGLWTAQYEAPFSWKLLRTFSMNTPGHERREISATLLKVPHKQEVFFTVLGQFYLQNIFNLINISMSNWAVYRILYTMETSKLQLQLYRDLYITVRTLMTLNIYICI